MGTKVHEQIEQLEFQTLDVDTFLMFRMWLKAHIMQEKVSMSSVIHFSVIALVLICVAVGTILTRLSEVTVGTAFLVMTATQLIGIVLLFTNEAVFINAALKELSVGALLGWRDRVLRQMLLSNVLVDRGLFTETRLHLDNYFFSLTEPLNQAIEQIDRQEKQLDIMGVEITEGLRTKLSISFLSLLITGVWHLTHQLRENLSDALLE